MNRRHAIAAMAGLAAASGRVGAARGPAGDIPLPELMGQLVAAMGPAPIRSEGLAPGLTLLSGPGGNVVALAGPDGVVVVDSFVPTRGVELAGVVRGLGAGPITLVNTHWHADHSGGNAALAGIGARIFAHANARARLGADQWMADYRMKVPAAPPAALPSVALGGEATLHLNGEEIRLVHAPEAHTDGDLFVHFRKADVLHAGDLFTTGCYPNIDNSSGGWVGGMVAAADRILGVVGASTRIVPGHGPVATPDDLRAFRAMLAEAHARVGPLVDAGRSVEEAVAARPLAGLDARWAVGPFRGSHFTRLVFGGLARRRARA